MHQQCITIKNLSHFIAKYDQLLLSIHSRVFIVPVAAFFWPLQGSSFLVFRTLFMNTLVQIKAHGG